MQIGCNYWASHAGTRMWELWDEKVVESDFLKLAAIGCRLIRVFPNWRDFQPIEAVPGWRGIVRGLRMKGQKMTGSDDVSTALRRLRKKTDSNSSSGS